MLQRLLFLVGVLVATNCFNLPGSTAANADEPTEKRIKLSIDAGAFDRVDVPVSVLIDAPGAQSVWIEFPDGSLGRSQLVEPGLLSGVPQGAGKKELHFGVPELAKGEKLDVVAAVSTRPIEGRTYVWSGEPSSSRRLSCMQCHQGNAPPAPVELREEWNMLTTTGKVPPLELPRLLPTAKGRDFRWHEMLGKLETSACWECHGRHMVQYEFGQSLEPYRPPGTEPDEDRQTLPPALQSIYYRVFRTAGDQVFARRPAKPEASPRLPCGIHYGFQQATHTGSSADDIIQRHAAILSEEAGKFIGRHSVVVDWISNSGRGDLVAREERELTVKNMRARNGTRSLWIEMASKLDAAGGPVHLDGSAAASGFQFVAPVDTGSDPEYRQSANWKAITFTFDGTTYTAVTFNHPDNPKPLGDSAKAPFGVADPLRPGERLPGVGFAFDAVVDEARPLVVCYRFWVQGGRMATEHIDAMSANFLQPMQITAE